ncbi:MAG: hypothetical protein ACD_9C00124G0003 [uncultured bacterium]|nr:MAG: hypothetical protein ACD_9C00124G0003 [uncultured bacterium]
MTKLNKVLIIERGEMGLRALEVCVEMKIGFVIGFSEADKNSLLVKKALEYSEKIEGSGIAYLGGEAIEDSYGNISNITATAKLWNCDAVYPGYGPLAEDYVAIRKFEKAKIRFIGPASWVVDIFSNKIKSRELAQQNGLKLLKAFSVNSFDEIAKICLEGKMQYPFIMKSFFAGGGRGNYLIKSDDDLMKTLSVVSIEKNSYYIEKYITGKHIEFQFIVDSEKVINLGTRDCSCQINFQKFLEECPAIIKEEKKKTIEAKINKMLLKVGYKGVGTAEFIYDEKKDEYYFLEINPRIQVEVPVTEKIFNIDMVKAQFLIANNENIDISKTRVSSFHAIEARVYARDIFNEFAQESKKIEKLVLPNATGIEIFSSYSQSDEVVSNYDPLILKVVSKGATREKAISSLKEALHKLVIVGPITNKELILWLLSTEQFKKNQITQDFSGKAWKENLKNEGSTIEKFLKTVSFLEHKYAHQIDPNKFPNKLRYFKNGVARNYIAELKSKRDKEKQKSAFRFGIFKKDGVQCIFAWWDFSFFGGTLGTEEAIGVEKCFKLANNKKLPLLMVSNSGGARQQENSFALHAMHYIVAVRKKYDIPLFINIYYRDNFGGVNASIIEQADIKIAVKGSRIGLAGPKFLSEVLGNNSGENNSSTTNHYRARNIDLVVNDFEEGCEKALSVFELLVSKKNKNLHKSKKHTFKDEKSSLNLLEILDVDSGIFENVVMFSNSEKENGEPLSVLGAFVQIKDMQAMVLGQYVPIIKMEDGSEEKKYIYPSVNDFKWFRAKIKLAEKLKIPIILFGDTQGADASFQSEYDGISCHISNSISDQLTLTVPIISVNIGLCGSGGGLPFVNTADFAIAFEKSLKLVSNLDVQTSIITGADKPSRIEQQQILDQLHDATAKVQKKYYFADEIISENNKKSSVFSLRELLIKNLKNLAGLEESTLVKRRFKRIQRVLRKISKR